MIATMQRDDLRLQWRRNHGRRELERYDVYRVTRSNGWHCGHWHRTPEDAVG